MSDTSILDEIIGAALPVHSKFGKENFAGDQEVKIFYDSLLYQYNLNTEIYVSWCCEPSAMLLHSPFGIVLVRSERMDTLLIEYVHLRELLNSESYSQQILNNIASATVLQWVTEFCIGYKLPSHALSAWQMSRKASAVYLSTHPYRDESLASIPEDLRISLQCFAIAHEIGHILYPKKENITLNEEVDGLELIKHIEHDFAEANTDYEAQKILQEQIFQQINVTNLFTEIEADFFALHCVISFLVQRFEISLEVAVSNSLYVFEALAYMNACKYDCKLLKQDYAMSNFSSRSYINGTELSIRSRCIMRRTGILWAQFDNPNKNLTATDINKYVSLVDNLYLSSQSSLLFLTQIIVDFVSKLQKEFENITTTNRNLKFRHQMNYLDQASEQRYELWKILIAYGCSGATDLNYFFEEQFSHNNIANKPGN